MYVVIPGWTFSEVFASVRRRHAEADTTQIPFCAERVCAVRSTESPSTRATPLIVRRPVSACSVDAIVVTGSFMDERPAAASIMSCVKNVFTSANVPLRSIALDCRLHR